MDDEYGGEGGGLVLTSLPAIRGLCERLLDELT
jgi:hypothetical protein